MRGFEPAEPLIDFSANIEVKNVLKTHRGISSGAHDIIRRESVKGIP